MIIERCRELALRAPARVVFPDALDQRVLKAAQYLHQQGLATPILVANPFELRQFALSHGVAMDGLQVIDPHGNLAMREEFAHRWLARAGEKTPPDALEKLTDPLMFAAAMVSAGKAAVCIAGNLSSTATRTTPYRLAARLQNALIHFPDAATVQRSGVGFCRLQRGATADGGAVGGYRACQRRNLAGHHRRRTARGEVVVCQ